MARMPGSLRVLVVVIFAACSGCAEWHFRKDRKARRVIGEQQC